MAYQIKILMLAFAIAFVISLIVIPILRRRKIGQQERDDGPKSHLKKQGTPTMGGIVMILAIIIIGAIVFLKYSKSIDASEQTMAKNLIPLILVTVGFGLVGFVDDFKKLILKNTEGLKPRYKMFGLLIIATAFTVYLTNVMHIGTDLIIPFAKTSITLPIWLYIPFTIFVMLGTTNAINLTDGIDGLSTSVTTIIPMRRPCAPRCSLTRQPWKAPPLISATARWRLPSADALAHSMWTRATWSNRLTPRLLSA